MKKLVEIAVPVVLGLVVGLLISVALAKAEPPNFDQSNYNYRPPPPKQESNASTVIDDLIQLFMAQGLAGGIIVILGIWTFRTDRDNRNQQKESFTKFVELNAECNSAMSTVAARLENIERELEASKQLQLLTSRS
jgi:hypothetical protein|tara:strand:+ start:61 stop:468 length:408 start_codon:yes stop_codon:yes gene_type:complete